MPGGRASISFDQSVYGRQMRNGFGTGLPVQTSSVAPNVQYVEFKGDGLSRGFGSSSAGNAFSRASQSAQAAQQSAQAAEVRQGADAIARDREDAAAAAAAAREERRKALMSAGLDLHRTFTSLPSENIPEGGAEGYGAAFMDSIAGFGNAMGDGRGWGDLVVANADSSVKTGWNDENGTFDFVYWNANERRPGISPYHVIRITPEELRGKLESAGLVESRDAEEKAAREKWDAAHAASIAEVTKLLGTQNISDENKAALNARLATLLGETYQSPSENGPQTVPASFFAEGNPTAFRHLFPTEARRRTAEKNKENTGGVFVGGEKKSRNDGETGVFDHGRKYDKSLYGAEEEYEMHQALEKKDISDEELLATYDMMKSSGRDRTMADGELEYLYDKEGVFEGNLKRLKGLVEKRKQRAEAEKKNSDTFDSLMSETSKTGPKAYAGLTDEKIDDFLDKFLSLDSDNQKRLFAGKRYDKANGWVDAKTGEAYPILSRLWYSLERRRGDEAMTRALRGIAGMLLDQIDAETETES